MNSQQKIQKWKSFTFTHQNDNIYLIQPTISLEIPVRVITFSQFSGCWLILSVYIIMSFDFPFVTLFGVRLLPLFIFA